MLADSIDRAEPTAHAGGLVAKLDGEASGSRASIGMGESVTDPVRFLIVTVAGVGLESTTIAAVIPE